MLCWDVLINIKCLTLSYGADTNVLGTSVTEGVVTKSPGAVREALYINSLLVDF